MFITRLSFYIFLLFSGYIYFSFSANAHETWTDNLKLKTEQEFYGELLFIEYVYGSSRLPIAKDLYDGTHDLYDSRIDRSLLLSAKFLIENSKDTDRSNVCDTEKKLLMHDGFRALVSHTGRKGFFSNGHAEWLSAAKHRLSVFSEEECPANLMIAIVLKAHLPKLANKNTYMKKEE